MTSGVRRGLLESAVAAAVILLVSGRAAVGQTVERGEIEGRVSDESGAMLPGVTVTVSSPALQARELATTTDHEGYYRVTSLPAGTYAVVYQLGGFTTYKREGLRLSSTFVATVDVRLQIGQMETEVTVTGETPVVDVRSTTATTSVTQELITKVPSSRSVEEIAKLAPGTRVEGVPDVGGSHTAGTRNTVTNYGSSKGGQAPMLDGINTDGTAGYFDVGAMQEVQLKVGGADAEVAAEGLTFLGVLKSGGNEFHGDFLAQGQWDWLQSGNIDDDLRAKGVTAGNPMRKYHDLNGGFGGRILRDRLWFYLNARDQEYVTRPLGFAGAPGPDGVYFTADDEPGDTGSSLRNYTGKLTAQLNPRHRLSGFWSYNNKHQTNRTGSRLKPQEATGEYDLPNHIYKVEWTYLPSAATVVNAFVGRSYWNSREVPYTDLPSWFDNVTQRYGGARVNSIGTDSTPSGSFSNRWQYNASVTHYKRDFVGGDHEFKVGAEYTREWYNKFQELRGPGTGGVGHDYLLTYSNGVPTEILFYNTPYESNNNVNNLSAYLKDSWRVNDRLTVNLGLRYDGYTAFLPEQSKPEGPFSQAATFPAQDLYDWNALAPRLGVSYALTPSKRTVVKATYGRFNFVLRASDSVTIRTFNENDYSAFRYRWSDQNGNRAYDEGERGAFLQTEGGSNTLYREIEQPKVDEITFSLEQEVARDLSARVGYVYKREFNQFQLVNLARPFDAYTVQVNTTDPGPDNRLGTADDGGPVTYYDYPAALAGPGFERSSYINTDGYTDSFHNIEASVQKRFSNRWQLLTYVLFTKKDVWLAGVPQTPNVPFPKDQTWDTTFRVSGSYELPWRVNLGGVYEYQSGLAQARDAVFRTGLAQSGTVTLRLEPVGAQRLPAVHVVNLRLDKGLKLGPGTATIGIDVYNALNSNVPTAVTVRSGASYGLITAIMPPRVARLGLRYDF